METLSHNFYKKNTASWERLENLNSKLDKRGYRSFSEDELRDYPVLYRKVCSDLAEARLKHLAPDLMAYLNQIAAASHSNLYGGRRNVREPGIIRRGLSDYFRAILPAALKRHRFMILISFILFFGSYGFTLYVVKEDPVKARVVVKSEVLDMMEESYSSSLDEQRGGAISSAMFSYYIQHNVSIAFISFACGILLGLGTVYFLIFNGIQLGAITGYIWAMGFGRNFLIFVTAHSVFELSGLVMAGAAGLLLGYTVISPGVMDRSSAFKKIKVDLLSLVGAATLLICAAASIEGFISPQPIPYPVKMLLFVCSLILILSYMVYVSFYGGRKR